MMTRHNHGWLLLPMLLAVSTAVVADEAGLTLNRAVALAQTRDPWSQGSLLQQQALQASSVSAGTLPDPQLSAGFVNLPMNSFDFDQEPMTQFKVGLSQSFSRGRSRALERQQLELLSEKQPLLRRDRNARVAATVAGLWLDAYLSRESIRLIEQDRLLFEYLVDVSQATYASGVGRSRQQEIIRAQLELTRLDDRLVTLKQDYETSVTGLYQWLDSAHETGSDSRPQQAENSGELILDAQLPDIEVPHIDRISRPGALDDGWVVSVLLQHPVIRSIDKEIDAEQTGIELAEQSYKPQWSVNASYGYRENAPDGMKRDDFFSVGVSFDLPVFTAKRQDKQVQAAVYEAEARRTEKWLALRRMTAELETARTNLLRLEQRQRLYQEQLLAQMRDQAEASLTAYTNDDGDFAEVVRAQIAELNAKIEALGIAVGQRKALADLKYYLAGLETASQIPAGEQR